MKLLKEMIVLSLLLGGFFVSGALAEETKETQTRVPQPSEKMKSKPLLTPVSSEDAKTDEKSKPAPSEGDKADEKPKAATPEVKKGKKHKSVASKAKEKPKPVASKAKETKSPATPKDTKASEATTPTPSGHKGWFVGVRAAYVPSAVLEIGYEFNETFKLRLLGTGGRYHQTYSVDNQHYNHMRFSPRKIGLMGDWHPWKNGLRLTGGIAYNGDRINAAHTVTGTLLGQPASVYGTITVNYKYRRYIAPYIGIGYDTGSLGDTGISLSADAGFWIQGKVRPSVNFTGTGQNTAAVIDSVKLHTATLLNKHKLIRNVPMVSLGMRYLF